jgi:hypothetical protein
MTFQELAELTGKNINTVKKYFYRHRRSIRKPQDVLWYVNTCKSGKRIESGKRNATHLTPYRFQPQPPKPDQTSCKAMKNNLVDKGLLSIIERKKINELEMLVMMFGAKKTKNRAKKLEQEYAINDPTRRFVGSCVHYINMKY